MSYGYGGRANPFDQREDARAQGGYQQPYMMPGASAPQYGRGNGPAMGRDDYSSQNHEMQPLTQNGSSFGSHQDPNAILNECREVDRGIDEIYANLQSLEDRQKAVLGDADSSLNSTASKRLEEQSTTTMAMYRKYAGRIKAIKQQPESGSPKNAPQVGKVDRRLKDAIREYQELDKKFRGKLQGQMARQYKIVRPEVSDEEALRAVEDTSNQQVFSQALLQSDRRGQSRTALNAVQDRHAAIQKIERQIVELAQLFEDMQQLVVQQEAAVVNIEMKGEEVVENMDKGTQEIGVAIKSARNARKWKWWCLGICVLIIIIIVVVVLIYKFVIQNNTPAPKAQRSLAEFLDMPIASRRVLSGHSWAPTQHEKRIVVPGRVWEGDSLTTERRRGIKFSG